MDAKKLQQIFLGSWAALLFLTVLTGIEAQEVTQAIIASGVLAGLITLLAWLILRGEKARKGVNICAAGSAEVLYHTEGIWIHKGWEEKVSWYLKRGAVYDFSSMTPLYHVKNGLITKEGEQEPFLRVEGDKILSCETGEVIYEIRE